RVPGRDRLFGQRRLQLHDGREPHRRRRVDGMVTENGKSLWAPLLTDDLLRRTARLKLVITDVDGVLTDGGIFFSESGEALKRFSVRDGMGVERLRNQGIETAFLTREQSAIVARRAEKLRIRHCYQGVADKAAFLPELLAKAGVTAEEIAYIGDDV